MHEMHEALQEIMSNSPQPAAVTNGNIWNQVKRMLFINS